MSKRIFTTTKQLVWFTGIIWATTLLAHALVMAVSNTDLSAIVTASTTVFTGCLGGYFTKSYLENKSQAEMAAQGLDSNI